MASVARFLNDADLLFNEIQKREKEAENCRRMEFIAVRNIQRWVRGYLERRHIARLHAAAITIQKTWRGYFGRQIYLQLLKETVEKMFQRYYNGMATRIQKVWHGHVVRLHVYNHSIFKHWMATVMMRNKEMHYENKRFKKIVKEVKENDAEAEAREHVLFILFKAHHLLRTYGIPGIYSHLDTNQLSVIEQQMQELDLTEYMESLYKERAQVRLTYGKPLPATLPSDITHRKCQEFWHKRVRVGKPLLLAQDKYVESTNMPKAVERRYTNPLERAEKPPMKLFSLVRYDDRPVLVHEAPRSKTTFRLRETNPSLNVSPQEFVVPQKTEDASTTYRTSKYGPFQPQISKTDLIIQKHQKNCNGVRRKDSK